MNPESRKATPLQQDPGATQENVGYAQGVHTAWSEFLQLLPRQARILDASLGNHVPALVAASLSTPQEYQWTIDAIDPQDATAPDDSRGRVNFHSAAGLVALPFADMSFDAVCGHHVLEFFDLQASLGEIHRVLRPGGDAQFLLNHADSMFLNSARMSLREADLVFNGTKAFRRVHRLVTMTQLIPDTTDRVATEVRLAIRALKRGVQVARQQGGGRVLTVALDAIQQLLAARKQGKPEVVGLAVDRAEADLRGSVRSLAHLVERARTGEDMRGIEHAAAAAGFTQVERIALTSGEGEPVAWQLLMHRP